MGDEITITRRIKQYDDEEEMERAYMEEKNKAFEELNREAKKRGVKLKGKHVNLLEELENGVILYEFSGEILRDEGD